MQIPCNDSARFPLYGVGGGVRRPKRNMNAMISIASRPRLNEPIQSLVRLYEATGRLEQAAEWRKKGKR
jgi:hypothetical protein